MKSINPYILLCISIFVTLLYGLLRNLYSKKYMKDGASVGIITNDFHMFRAMQITKGEGLKSAKAIAAGSNPLYLPNNMLREYLAEWKYLIRSIL